MRQIIKDKLKEIEEKENIKIVLAVESGSRAWGFDSPDSDYDVRFIYVRKVEDYLSLENKRDVIEWQLDETFDINGWDLKKSLILLHNSNPTIFEWLSSPLVYRESEYSNELRMISGRFFSEKKILYHYLHMAENNNIYLRDSKVNLKKYFYVLRPLLASNWIIANNSNPPTLFEDLLKIEKDEKILNEINRLLKIKVNSTEVEMIEKVPILDDYIKFNINKIREYTQRISDKRTDWNILNTFFIKILKEN